MNTPVEADTPRQAFQPHCELLFDTVFFTFVGGTPVDNDPHLVLPMTFVNTGTAPAIVEWLRAKVVSSQGTKLFVPRNLVNHREYLQGGGMLMLNTVHVLSHFSGFQVSPGKELQVSVHFSQEKQDERYPYLQWSAGPHVVELYVKYRDRDKPVLSKTLDIAIAAELLAKRPLQSRLVQNEHIDI